MTITLLQRSAVIAAIDLVSAEYSELHTASGYPFLGSDALSSVNNLRWELGCDKAELPAGVQRIVRLLKDDPDRVYDMSKFFNCLKKAV